MACFLGGVAVLSWRTLPNLLLTLSSLFRRGKTVLIQPFSQKSHTPTVPKEFQIGLYDPAEADLEHFWNCCSAGFLGERL